MLIYYDDELGDIIADECADCEHSYVDDLFFEWMCRRNRCKYTKAEREEIMQRTKAEIMAERGQRMKLYGGIRIGDDVIGITHMPDRKRPCLYYQKGYVIYPLAYFTSEEHADLFWEQLQRFTVKQSGKE